MQGKTALLSVYHKDGIVEFAKALVDRGWNILASGGTAKTLAAGGVQAKDIGGIVGGPILGHRVVTLSREVHAGLLARDIPDDIAELERLGLFRIDLVCVDLYPLREAIAKPGSTRASVIEMTDVGGPTMLHSAAKGGRIVVCDPADRNSVIRWLDGGCPDRERFIDRLNAKADATVAEYCLAASRYRSGGAFDGFVGELDLGCKYGENAWQAPAGLYRVRDDDPLALHNFRVVAGSAPSYNNLCDVDRMLQTMTHIAAAFDVNRKGVPHIAIGVKHGNPCGAAVGTDEADVACRMATGDNRAIFGGLVMTTFSVSAAIADTLLYGGTHQKRLFDGVIAPGFHDDAVDTLARKGGKCRLLVNPALGHLDKESLNGETKFRQVRGGFLKQPNYTFVLDLADPSLQWFGDMSVAQENDLLTAWAVGSTSNSNTVTIVKDGQLIGNGVGQQDRVGCCELALKRAADAGHDVKGAVAYSDSFFPFPDGPEVLAEAGISAILASSASVKDGETKAACEKHGVALVMVPDATGRGFYNH